VVRQSNPIKKSKKAKTERGRIWGSASMTKIGTVRKSHVTIPQNTRPADAKMINFFFFDGSMSFIQSLSQDESITVQMLHAEQQGWFPDRREGHKKSAARRGQAALLPELALNAPLYRKLVERTSERSTDARE
jgi:hypothetical protein